MENIWRDFAELHGMSPERFKDEILEVAQVVLAMHLAKEGGDEVTITNGQHDGVYQLNFKRIIK